jgi:hypothetical protein
MSQPYPPAGQPPGYSPPQQFGQNPFGPGPSGGPYPPPPPSGGGKTLLIVFGALGIGVLLCCGSCGGLGYVTIQNEHKEHAQTLKSDYNNHPIVLEQLGGLDSVEGNMAKGINDDESDMVFDVRGPKGTGTMHIEAMFGEIYSAILKKDGQEWDLTAEEEAPDDMPADDEAMPAEDAVLPGGTDSP